MRIHKVHPDVGEVRNPRSTCERCEKPLTETVRMCWKCMFESQREMAVYDAGPADWDEYAGTEED